MSLATFAAMHPELIDQFTIFAVVKEVNVDGLSEFMNVYFRGYPVYADKSYAFYKALGDRKVGLSALFNPFSMLGAMCEAWNRIRRKNIEGTSPTSGEGIVQGGLIVFDEKGTPQAMYPEETGSDLRVADLAHALNAIRNRSNQEPKEDGDETGPTLQEEKKVD